MIEKVKEEVDKLLEKEDSGHDSGHVARVLELALKFAREEKTEVNEEIVSLIALLHDVDDYKIFGQANASDLTNAKLIMTKANVPSDIKEQVLASLKCIGYSKSLQGIRPTTLEGKIVSDADMCDALGVTGVLRVYKYSLKYHKPFFDKNIFPVLDMSYIEYVNRKASSSVCHIFEKILKLKDLMLTAAGKEEALKRHEIVVLLLYHLFDEENVPEWRAYLDSYLN